MVSLECNSFSLQQLTNFRAGAVLGLIVVRPLSRVCNCTTNLLSMSVKIVTRTSYSLIPREVIYGKIFNIQT